jgi:hypothetical protein
MTKLPHVNIKNVQNYNTTSLQQSKFTTLLNCNFFLQNMKNTILKHDYTYYNVAQLHDYNLQHYNITTLQQHNVTPNNGTTLELGKSTKLNFTTFTREI